MKTTISSESSFHQIIIQKDVTNVDYNFKTSGKEKNNFLFHWEQQTGGALNQQLPVNDLKRGPTTYFSINFFGNKNFYDFFDEKIVGNFFNSAKELFNSVRGK